MNVIDYLYTVIFSASYQDGNYNRKIDPNSWTSLCLGMAIGSWYLSISTICFYFKFHNTPSEVNIYITTFIVIFFGGVINWFYTRNDRYFILYTEYKKRGKALSKGKVLFLIVLLSLVPQIISAVIIFNW
jgi:hypothetical protein